MTSLIRYYEVLMAVARESGTFNLLFRALQLYTHVRPYTLPFFILSTPDHS